MRIFFGLLVVHYYLLFSYTAVEGVEVTVVNDTSVTVSWNELIIPDFSFDYYTVVYSLVAQNEEMSAVFPSPATSGVITDLDSTDVYQFQVFATVTVGGRTVDLKRSTPVYFRRPRKKTYMYIAYSSEYDQPLIGYSCSRRSNVDSGWHISHCNVE